MSGLTTPGNKLIILKEDEPPQEAGATVSLQTERVRVCCPLREEHRHQQQVRKRQHQTGPTIQPPISSFPLIQYVLESVSDVDGTRGKKSWYYFSIKCPVGYRVRVSIQNVAIL